MKEPRSEQPRHDSKDERAPYTPPKVQSVKLSQEAAESLT